MEQENVDPVYKYIDNNVKLIKRELKKLKKAHDMIANQQSQTSLELQQLKVAHDAVANKHAQMLLVIQRTMAAWEINSNVQTYSDIIFSQLSRRTELSTQLVADAANAKSQILTSNEPFDIGTNFKNKWSDILEKSGAKIITF